MKYPNNEILRFHQMNRKSLFIGNHNSEKTGFMVNCSEPVLHILLEQPPIVRFQNSHCHCDDKQCHH